MGVVISFFQFLGSIGLFLYGMKTLSEGIQRAAGESLRTILRRATRNPFIGILSGFALTVAIQFSSAATVMFVSFANAELLTVLESFSLIIGANIGTTVKGWIFALIGFQNQIQLSTLAIVLLGLFFPVLFSRNPKVKYTAEFFFGLGILLIGLDFLKKALPDLQHRPELLEWIQSYQGNHTGSVLLFVLIGLIITALLQSSSATMVIVLVMVNRGWIDFTNAAALILGENLGTTITANLAALVANNYAKRAALFHTLFNFTGVLIFLPLLPLMLGGIDWICIYVFQIPVSTFSTVPEALTLAIPIGLVLFHTLFNVTTALLVLPFMSKFEKLTEKIWPTHHREDEEHHLHYLSGRLLNTAEISIEEARQEIARFGNITRRTTKFVQTIVDEKETKSKEDLIERLAKYDKIINRIESELTSYLSRATEQEISFEASQQIRSMLVVISELENIGEICLSLSRALERKTELKIWFNQDQRDHLKELYLHLDKAFATMIQNLENNYESTELDKSIIIETSINAVFAKARDKNLKQIEKGKIKLNGALIFNELAGGYESIGNHILRVSQALATLNSKKPLIEPSA
jgi:phosphate:Na+ symporter